MKQAGSLLACALLFAAMGGVACQTAYRAHRDIPPELTAHAVMVYPFGFRWPEPAWRSFELSQRLIDVALAEAGEQALFFGPSEFKVYRPQEDNAWVASNAVSRLVSSGVRPDQALVLRPWAERRVHSVQRESHDVAGRRVGTGSVEETAFLGHVEVLHPSSGRVLVEVTGEAVPDPFAEHSDEGADPSPELTRLMVGLTREALAALDETLRPPRPPTLPLAEEVILIPWETFTYSEEGRPAFAPELAALDALDAEVVRQQRLRFANPGLAPRELTQLARMPAGLYVLEAPAGGKLAPGELVVGVEEGPALPQTLARMRFSLVPTRVRVRRPDGNVAERLLP
ncbi:hypothetical protein ACN28E_18985 [Archangium lansingense]|uniref:hypothetical protein n=1 Tax=Archangium lansingense TaxID=2995310 RepID=UPI003B7F48C3